MTCCPSQSPIPASGFLSFGRFKEAPRCGEYLPSLPLPWPLALKKHLWVLFFASSSLAQSFPKMARLFHLARIHFPFSQFLKFCLLLALEHREEGLVAPLDTAACVCFR